jgi:DNA-binding LacI/PurR family transcriptional regulator
MSETSIPLYQRIYNDLVSRIKRGEYKDGDRIPSEKELAEEYSVSRITSKKALEMMAERGLIARAPGKGSFVKEDIPSGSEHRSDNQKQTNRKPTLVGLILPDFSEAFGTTLLSGIEWEASRENCFLVVKKSYGKQDMEESVIDALLELGVDGILIMPVHGELYNRKILQLTLDEFPIVSIDRCMNGIPVSFVGTDNIGASKKATDFMLDLGHKQISILCPPYKNTSTVYDRVEGFIKSHAEHGVGIDDSLWLTDLTSTLPGKNSEETRTKDVSKIMELLKSNPGITCLYALEYNIALLAMKAAKSIGKSVPDDLSIVCFDSPDSPYNYEYEGGYRFTFVRQKEAEMGATALKLLIGQMKEKKKSEKIYLDADLVIGLSTKECI